MSKIFLICPVRNMTQKQKVDIQLWIYKREKAGDEIYWPFKDTNQSGNGTDICLANLAAINTADKVAIYYDSRSEGSIFDLGMCWALGKSLMLVNKEKVSRTEGKSFANLILDWIE